MKSFKTFGLAAIAAVAAMAFVGATSASATNTSLCKVHTSLACAAGNQYTSTDTIHFLNEGVSTLLNDIKDVLCLSTLANAKVLGFALANPLALHASLTYSFCGTDAAHDNCTITEEGGPTKATLLKSSLDQGTLKANAGQLVRHRVICEDLTIFQIDIDCKYDPSGLELKAGGGLTVETEAEGGTPVTQDAGASFICPEKSTIDSTMAALGTAPASLSLCKAHTTKCAEKDQVKSLHMATTKPPVLYNTVANVECESSLGAATVLGAADPQKLDVTALTWKECHTQGAADNCTVTSKTLPTLDLKKGELNLGTVTTLGLKVGIDCTVLGLIELDCVYGSDFTLQAEGALHKEGTGHGMFTASKVVLKKLEGTEHCPESVKWDALYEPSEPIYIVGTTASSGGVYILG